MLRSPSVLSVDDLAFGYQECPVLQGVSIHAKAGLTWVCGDESTGKTTLLRLLAGQLAPQRGRIALRGLDAAHGSPAYRAQVFFVDPRAETLDHATAQAWLEEQAQRFPRWSAAALGQHIAGFALAEHLGKPFHALSTGTRRKVCMAAALASRAPLALIDDPIAGLDKPSVAYLAQALDGCVDETECAVVVAHYAPLPGVRGAHVVELPAV